MIQTNFTAIADRFDTVLTSTPTLDDVLTAGSSSAQSITVANITGDLSNGTVGGLGLADFVREIPTLLSVAINNNTLQGGDIYMGSGYGYLDGGTIYLNGGTLAVDGGTLR